jgi:hypothetical protein
LSYEDPFCVFGYSTAGYDFDGGFYYDPSTSSFSVDPNTNFTPLNQERTGRGQTYSAPVTAQDDDRASGPLPAFLNKEISSTGYEDADSDSSGTVGNLGYLPHDDSDYQSYLDYGADPSLEHLDLSTPAIPSTPNSQYDPKEGPTDQNLGSTASGLPPGHSSSFSNQPKFKCPKCSKTFDTKSKFT